MNILLVFNEDVNQSARNTSWAESIPDTPFRMPPPNEDAPPKYNPSIEVEYRADV